MSGSSTTLSQDLGSVDGVSKVVNERLAVGQWGSRQKAECQSGRIGLEQERKRAATRKSLGSSRVWRSQTQRQTGVNAVAAGPHSLMRVKSCICSRMQAVWIRQFDWRIGVAGCTSCMLAAELRLSSSGGHMRWTPGRVLLSDANRAGAARAARAGRLQRRHTLSGELRVCIFPRAPERGVVDLAGGFNKGRRSPLPPRCDGRRRAVRPCSPT